MREINGEGGGREGGKKDKWEKTCVLSSSVVTELATWTSAVTNFIPGQIPHNKAVN